MGGGQGGHRAGAGIPVKVPVSRFSRAQGRSSSEKKASRNEEAIHTEYTFKATIQVKHQIGEKSQKHCR